MFSGALRNWGFLPHSRIDEFFFSFIQGEVATIAARMGFSACMIKQLGRRLLHQYKFYVRPELLVYWFLSLFVSVYRYHRIDLEPLVHLLGKTQSWIKIIWCASVQGCWSGPHLLAGLVQPLIEVIGKLGTIKLVLNMKWLVHNWYLFLPVLPPSFSEISLDYLYSPSRSEILRPYYKKG